MDAAIPREVLIRIQMEYLEMPGLMLTPRQIGRLCGLPLELCEGALTLLARTGFLSRSGDGAFRRPGPGYTPTRRVIA